MRARPGNTVWHGYHLSKLYSPMTDIRVMVEASRSPAIADVQEFHRSDLGEVYVPRGGSLSIADLDACRQGYEMPSGWEKYTSMGVDVGTKLHVVIREELPKGKAGRALYTGTVGDRQALDELIARYNVTGCLIDGLPEQRLASEFRDRHKAEVWLAYYDRRQGDHDYEWAKGMIHINRTLALHELFERFRRRELALPKEARRLGGRVKAGVGEYYRQLTAVKRVLEQDGEGNWCSRYVKSGKPDHFAHAEVYCMLAKPRRSRVEAAILGSDDRGARTSNREIFEIIEEMQNANLTRFPRRRL